jgi:hypothetical protein
MLSDYRGALPAAKSAVCSKMWAIWMIPASANADPMICIPTGSVVPLSLFTNPQGSATAGSPAF